MGHSLVKVTRRLATAAAGPQDGTVCKNLLLARRSSSSSWVKVAPQLRDRCVWGAQVKQYAMAGTAACMRGIRNAFRVLLGNLEDRVACDTWALTCQYVL
jgi:hypothetical protein